MKATSVAATLALIASVAIAAPAPRPAPQVSGTADSSVTGCGSGAIVNSSSSNVVNGSGVNSSSSTSSNNVGNGGTSSTSSTANTGGIPVAQGTGANANTSVGPQNPGHQIQTSDDGNGNTATSCSSNDGTPCPGIDIAPINFPANFPFNFNKKRDVSSSTSIGAGEKGSKQDGGCDEQGNCSFSFSSNDGSQPDFNQLPPQIKQLLAGINNLGALNFSLRKRGTSSSTSIGPGEKGSKQDGGCDDQGNCSFSFSSNDGSQPDFNQLPPQIKQLLAGMNNIGALKFPFKKRDISSSSSIGPGETGSKQDGGCDEQGNCSFSFSSNDGSQPDFNQLPPQIKQLLAGMNNIGALNFPFKKRDISSSTSIGPGETGSKQDGGCDEQGNCSFSFSSNDGSQPDFNQLPPQLKNLLAGLF